MGKQLFTFFVLILVSVVFITSCKKDTFIKSAEASLYITADTLKYDTVLTSTGSITKSFKIINENNQKLLLSKVKLMGGSTSAYKINVNGTAATEVDNIEIAANDSIYVFVSVTINPNAANLPFVVSDSILVNYNGNNRYVQLQAFGQNANFLRGRVITGNVVWNSSLPYVILGSIRVDTTASLTIQPGVRIYSHADAPFIVDGTLVVNGTKTDSVVFAGDRLDGDYKDYPAGWPGIYFRGSSKNNVLTHTVVKNAYQAIVAEQPALNGLTKVTLHRCVVDNAYDAGIYCISSSLQADNSLVSNCGKNVLISYGGTYSFTNCTVAAYSNYFIDHKNAVLNVSNAALYNGAVVTADLAANFTNCIFWGDAGFVDNEVVVSKQGNNLFNVAFNNNIYRNLTDPASSVLTANIKNTDPAFDSIDVVKRSYDFHTTKNTLAPGINKGTATGLPLDLDDKNRSNGITDIGCYEKQ